MMVLDKGMERVPLTFTRASVAYDYQGNSVPVDTPRFEHLIGGNIERGVLIEEAHTNLLTADASQEILHATPYTTGTLNGTYTFQCEGTGSYVLSGGATGTVSKDNPITAEVVSATVTLTPAVSSTLNQILKTAYPLSWTLGGTTQAKETLTAPSSVLNIKSDGTGEITFEAETLLTNLTTTKDIIYFRNSPGINAYAMDIVNNNVRNLIYDETGKYKLRQFSSAITTNSFYKLAASQQNGTLEMYINGVKSSESYSGNGGTGKLTANPSEIYIGGHTTGTQKFNGLIKNITISTIKRTDEDVTARAGRPSGKGFGVDRQVSLVAPLTHSLQAYKMARG